MFFVGIIVLIIIHWFAFGSNEGFDEGNSAYETLRTRLQTDLADYCETGDFVRSQITQMMQATGGSATAVEQVYKDMYACRDILAKSRPSCQIELALQKANITGTKLNRPASNLKYLPCSTFLDLPDWTNDSTPVLALKKIKDDLPERLTKETEWFDAVITKLQESLDTGANPPTVNETPRNEQKNDGEGNKDFIKKNTTVPSTPSEEEKHKYDETAKERARNEGFETICSAQAAALKEAQNCTIPDINSEIARVNAILDTPIVQNAVGKCKAQKTAMLKIQSDLEKAKNGELYDWQKDPGKSPGFPKFQGGDRSQAFIHSMQQNR